MIKVLIFRTTEKKQKIEMMNVAFDKRINQVKSTKANPMVRK